MKLIIAEKPMLARAISAAIPGNAVHRDGYEIKGDYAIVAAFGHLLTLKEPEDYDAARYGKWSLDALPIYFENWGKKPGNGKSERLNLIGSLLKDAECVIHAGDPDDEGQYLIDEILQWFNYKGPVWRLATGDTTEGALQKALASMKDNSEFVNSGWSAHARSVADIMVGFNFSRYFSLKNSHVKMLTVGRVQTPTLGLVVTRDLLIENHEKQCYYIVRGKLAVDGHSITAKYEPAKDDPNLDEGRITDKDYADEIVQSLDGRTFDNIKVTSKAITEQPPLPFNLVKLQTYCSNKFGYDPSKTLEITQRLRDNHNAITYNRSDCQYLSEEQYKESPATIRQLMENLKDDSAGSVFARMPVDTSLHGKAFNDKNITAHTAIIPQRRKLDLKKLSEEERNVYLAIAKYFIAQFLPAAEKERTTLEAALEEGGCLKANSTKVLKAGFMQLIKPEKKKDADSEEDEESELSSVESGTYEGVCTGAEAEEKETKAPPRYTKASLNEDMTRIAKYVTDPKAKKLLMAKDKDKKGENGSIGTSATRSSIIDNLEARGFIESKGKQIQSTQLGRELYRILPDELKKPDMTGLWWAVQESIQEGQVPWTALTDSVLDMIKKVVKTDYPKVDAYHVPESMRRGKLLLGQCPRCGSDIVEGANAFGCGGYKNGCRFVIWKTAKSGMMSKTEITADMVHDWLSCPWIDETKADRESGELKPTGRKRSSAAVYIKKCYSENKKKNYPGKVYLADDGPSSEYGASFGLEEIVNEPPKPLGKCPRCGRDVIEGKNGYGCTGYTEGCRFVIWKKAKSGMMSKTKVTRGVVRNLLKSPWIDEIRPGEDGTPQPTGRKRTEKCVHVKKLYSPAKDKIYTGDVFLSDEGPASQYGASFGLERVTDDGPEILGKCPRCGKDVIEGRLGYGCTGFKDGCKFTIWKNSKMKLLANITFTKTDARKFLAGKPARKRKLVDKKGKEFIGEIIMIEEPDNPYGPVWRVIEGTIELKDGSDPSVIKTETVPRPDAGS
ncbi:MAG: DNA topoisomerase [Clostridia bacterium]|nr:DNA topoisomerase [Clostridia bacterium]